jgi:putative pyruvate formate lyase activating enzyme
VNRNVEATGVCRTGRLAPVVSAFAHLGEEDCLRGWKGSGTIFFGLCNLQCVFCQNEETSRQVRGHQLPAHRIADLMLHLEDQGCHNINLVTPTHVAAQVLEATADAVRRGLRLPIVYNCSGYDSVQTLRLLDGIVDIYMPDFKLWNASTAARLCLAEDYPQRARAAIQEMHRQVGPLKFAPDGLARRGLLVRHLVMPGLVDQSAAIFGFLADLSPDTFVNIMAQYRPACQVGLPDSAGHRRYAEIDRPVRRAEMQAAYRAARQAGLWRFAQRQLA